MSTTKTMGLITLVTFILAELAGIPVFETIGRGILLLASIIIVGYYLIAKGNDDPLVQDKVDYDGILQAKEDDELYETERRINDYNQAQKDAF